MSGTLILSPKLVDAYRQLLTKPEEHSLSFPKLSDCFEPSDKATPKHILHEQYQEFISRDIPKVVFYIIMDKLYPIGKADTGQAGYFLSIKTFQS